MWELELIPVYLLVSMWGGKKRLYSATKFILYTAGGSIFLLMGVLGIGLYSSTEPTFTSLFPFFTVIGELTDGILDFSALSGYSSLLVYIIFDQVMLP